MNDTALRPRPGPDVVPRFRGRLHQIAFFVSIPAGLTVVLAAPGPAMKVSALVFALGVTGMFASSASYHRLRWTPIGRDRVRRLDHSMIYVAIAGTYTPITVAVLDGWQEIAALAIVWSAALGGILVKVFGIDRLRLLGSVMYGVLGWSAVVALPQIFRTLSWPPIVLMFVGGLLYSGGAIVLARRKPDPDPAVFGYHEIWHSFVVGGWACHWAMVLVVLLGLR
ncbi:MAG TPA: hemolysin III family protein [Actinomycetota bacterium]|nr:hemolysin III family protein [Actinomycetota bacterium]